MQGRFRNATAVERVGGDETSARFGARIHEGWDIGGNANGGYLLAIAARAMTATVEREPLTLTAHYLRPAPAGPCEIDVGVVRAGRRLATVDAVLGQDGRALVRLLGTFGRPGDDGPRHLEERPIDMPPVDECVPRPQTAELPTLMSKLRLRLHPDDVGFATGHPTGTALMRGWFDLLDDEPIDVAAMLLAADSFAPAVYNTGLEVARVPTVELTVHVRGEPAPGPLRCRFRSRFVQGGLVDEDGTIWDSAGNLVAQSRQLALAPGT